MKLIISILVLLIVPSLASANVLVYEYKALVDTSGVSHTISIAFSDGIKDFQIPLLFDINNFDTKANFEGYNCSAYQEDWGTNIECNFNKLSSSSGALSLIFDVENPKIRQIGNSLLFEDSVSIPFDANKMRLETKLEEGLILSKTENLPPLFPENGVVGVDVQGRRIIVAWEKTEPKRGDSISSYVIFESTKKGSDNILIFVGLFAIIMILVIGVFFYRKRGMEITSKLPILRDDERKVLEILEAEGGKTKQKNIQQKGDFSKATLSRLIKNLEERGLVKTERFGRTNRVYLNREIGKVKEVSKENTENQKTHKE